MHVEVHEVYCAKQLSWSKWKIMTMLRLKCSCMKIEMSKGRILSERTEAKQSWTRRFQSEMSNAENPASLKCPRSECPRQESLILNCKSSGLKYLKLESAGWNVLFNLSSVGGAFVPFKFSKFFNSFYFGVPNKMKYSTFYT